MNDLTYSESPPDNDDVRFMLDSMLDEMLSYIFLKEDTDLIIRDLIFGNAKVSPGVDPYNILLDLTGAYTELEESIEILRDQFRIMKFS